MRLLKRLPRGSQAALLILAAVFVSILWLGAASERTAFALALAGAVACAYFGGMQMGVAGIAVGGLALVIHNWHPRPDGAARSAVDFACALVGFTAAGTLACYLSSECRRSLRLAGQVRQTLAQLRDAAIVTDHDGRVWFANPAAETLTGWQSAAARLPLDRVFQVVDEDGGRPGPGLTARLLAAEGPVPPAEAVLVAADGRERVVEFWAEPVRDPAGKHGVAVLFRDVSERRRREDDLRRRERQFRVLAERAAAGLVFLDRAGHCTYSNAAAELLGGFNADEGLGGWARAVHAEDEGVAADWTAHVRQGKPYAGELRVHDAHGHVRWLRLRSDLGCTEDGACLGHVATLEDVTARKQLESEVAGHRKGVESLKRQAHETVEAVRREHAEKERQAADRLAALEQERARLEEQVAERQRAADEARRAHEAEQGKRRQHAERERQAKERAAELEKERARLEQQLADRPRLEQELTEHRQAAERLRQEHQAREGGWREEEARLRRQVEEHGRARQAADERHAALGRELNELRAGHQRAGEDSARHARLHQEAAAAHASAERQLQTTRAVLAALDEGVCAVDGRGFITFANPAAGRLSGEKAEDLIGRPLAELAEGPVVERLRDAPPDRAVRVEGVRLRTAAGRAVPVDCTLAPLNDGRPEDGAVLALRGAAERRADGSWDRLADRLRPVTAGVHEAAARLRQRLPAEGPERVAADRLEYGTHRLAALLDGLWVAGRVGRGLALEREPVELNAVVRRAVAAADCVLRERRQHLTLALPLQPGWFLGDAARLEEALVLLLDRAAWSTRAGGAIGLTADRTADGVVLRVSAGEPAADATVPPVAAWWTGVGPPGPDEVDGPRLGLALVRSLVEWHGGSLVAAEAPAGGGEVVLRLPALAAQAPPAPEPMTRVQAG